MRAEEMFENYGRMLEERKALSEKIRCFEGLPADRDPEGNLSDKTIRDQENNDYRLYMTGRYRKLDAEITFFEDAVRSLGEKKSVIIFELLRHDLTWDEIAGKYRIGKSTLSNYRKRAIKAINEQYEFRDRLDLEYLLS